MVGLQNPQPDAFSRRRNAEMITHRHIDEGRDVKQLVVVLPDTGDADLAGLHRKHVSVDVAEGVADLVDEKGKAAIRAIAKID